MSLPTPNFHTLDQLPRGSRALLIALEPAKAFGSLDERVGQRLMELGFVPGVELEVLGHGFFSRDPIAVRLGDSKFALRRAEASKLRVVVR